MPSKPEPTSKAQTQRLIVKSKISPKGLFIYRVFAFIWILTHLILNMYNSGAPKFLADMLKYFTWWGLQLTLVYFAWSLFWGIQPASVSRHFSTFNQNVFTANFFVLAFYFGVLFETAPLDLNQYLAVSVHSTPFMLIFIETLLNNTVFYWYAYCKYIWVVAVYGVVNLVFTLADEPVYNVLDYTSVTTLVYLLISLALTWVGHCLGMLVQLMFKHLVYETVRRNGEGGMENGVALASGKEVVVTNENLAEGEYLTDKNGREEMA